MTNTFLHTIDQVHFDKYKPSDAKEAVDLALKEAKANIAKLKKIKKPTFENTVLGLTRSDEKLEFVTGVISHLESMKTSVWQEARDYAIKKYVSFGLEVEFDQKIYLQLKILQDDGKVVDKLELRLLDKLIKNYQANGIHLPKDKQIELKKLSKRSAKLSTQFRSNILLARDNNPIIVRNISQLKGVRNDIVESYREAAAKAGVEGFLISNDDGNFDHIMTTCSISATRKKFHRAYSACVTNKNNKIMFELLTIRQKQADILGFENPGAMLMRERMLNTPQKALDFIEPLLEKYSHKAKIEYQELLNFVRKNYDPTLKNLEQFDFDSGIDMYYPAKYFENKFKINLDETKEYFEFNRCLSFMLESFSKLYGINFRRLQKKSWHKDVQVYAIFDSSKKQLAEVHCDWFSRKDKHGHAWMNEFVNADRSIGVEKPHIGCVIMNISPATAKLPALMPINSVETMWHEFGHFIHFALSNTRLKEQGMNHVKRDFIEAPSQIMENWVLHDDVLPKYAKHYKTGKPLAKNTVRAIKNMSLFNIGIKTMRQLYFAYLDLLLHSGLELKNVKEMSDFAFNLREKYLPVKPMPYFAILATFAHITDGYASGYYTYKWSDSLQADLFSRFESEGVFNEKTGEDFKNSVLSRGDEVEPDILVKEFLHRAPKPEAMLKRDGII